MVPKITWRMRLEWWLTVLRHPIDSFQYAMMVRYCDRHDLGLHLISDSVGA
jgi:hypothetical protein